MIARRALNRNGRANSALIPARAASREPSEEDIASMGSVGGEVMGDYPDWDVNELIEIASQSLEKDGWEPVFERRPKW